VNTKIKWNIPMLAMLPDFRKAIQLKDKMQVSRACYLSFMYLVLWEKSTM